MGKPIVDRTGEVLGIYTILSREGFWNDSSYYKYSCSCGTVRIARYYDIKKRSGQHCRCKDNKTSQEICLDQLYQRYKYTCNHRKPHKEFLLSKEETNKLFLDNCHYCSRPPDKHIITVNKHHKLAYNGIDRKNNTLGYITDNVVSCCWKCNEAKKDMSYEEFKDWIFQVYNNLNKG